jgi:drug/metabolite transporter (DMT)-like permease
MAAPTRSRLVAGILMVVVSALWGTVPPLFKVLSQDASPWTVACYRFAIAFIVSWLVLIVFRRKVWPFRARMTNRSILFAGIIGIGLGIGAYGWAIHRGRTVDAAFLFYTYPIMIVFASSTQQARRKSPRSIVGMLLAFSGCASILVSAHTGGLLVELLGYALLPLIAAVCWTAYTLLLRTQDKDTTDATVLSYVPGILTLAAASLFLEGPRLLEDSIRINATQWGALVFLGVVATAFAFAMYNKSIAISTEASSLALVYLTPLFTLLYSVLFLGERVMPLQMLGGSLILLGIGIARPRTRML